MKTLTTLLRLTWPIVLFGLLALATTREWAGFWFVLCLPVWVFYYVITLARVTFHA